VKEYRPTSDDPRYLKGMQILADLGIFGHQTGYDIPEYDCPDRLEHTEHTFKSSFSGDRSIILEPYDEPYKTPNLDRSITIGLRTMIELRSAKEHRR
jgi:hypothetical protein